MIAGWLAEPQLANRAPAFADGLRRQSVYTFASLKLRRTRFAPTVAAWLRHA
jgi:hypothetical protein